MGAVGLLPPLGYEVERLTTDVLLLLPAWVWLWRLPVVLPQVTDDEVLAELDGIVRMLLPQGEG